MPTAISNPARHRLLKADDFINWLQRGVLAELIAGEKCRRAPDTVRNLKLRQFLNRLLASYVEAKLLGEVFTLLPARVSPRNVFLPDICLFTKEQVERIVPGYAPFAPTFVVELLSKWTVARDTAPKFANYEAHGVQEYWRLDPESLAHRFYRREGEFLVEFGSGAEVIRAHSIPGFFVKRDWLNPGALPEVSASLREILGAPS